MKLTYFGKDNKEMQNKESLAIIEFKDGEEEKMQKAFNHIKNYNWDAIKQNKTIYITLYGGAPHFRGFKRFYDYMKKYKI